MNIPWTERQVKKEVLQRMDSRRELLIKVKERQMRFLVHVMRREELKNESLTKRGPGSKARGKNKVKCVDGIVRAEGGVYSDGCQLQITRNRKVWHSMVDNVSSRAVLK